jgi:acyl-CoA thioester hydrolase
LLSLKLVAVLSAISGYVVALRWNYKFAATMMFPRNITEKTDINVSKEPFCSCNRSNPHYIYHRMTTALPHLHPIGVSPEDIDFMGHVNNARYLGWVQDAVLAHWNKLAPPEAAAKYLWVALKHEITYRKPAFLDDEVIASVVLEKVQGARSFYETVIKRGEEVLAEVKSSWCCIDAETLRPARIAAEIQEYFFPK